MDFTEVPAIQAAKRCGVQWTPWMDDWFTSWSPRNNNNNAEGTWEHWVDLALGILRALVFSQRAPEPDPRLGIPPGRSADT